MTTPASDRSLALQPPATGTPSIHQETAVTEPTARTAAPTAWIDGHPQLEAIAAAVWEQCEHADSGLVIDDPRNIAVAAYAAAPPPADRDALRDRIINALHEARRPGPGTLTEAGAVGRMADAVMGVLPAVADWAAVQPRRGDQFEQWLKTRRDAYGYQGPTWVDLDNVLDRYRLHADTGTPLSEHVCEGRTVGDCECFEAQQDGAQP